MKKSPDPSPTNDWQLNDAPAADLEFPVVADYVSHSARVDPQAMLRRLSETMPWRSVRPDVKAQRLEQRVAVEFVW